MRLDDASSPAETIERLLPEHGRSRPTVPRSRAAPSRAGGTAPRSCLGPQPPAERRRCRRRRRGSRRPAQERRRPSAGSSRRGPRRRARSTVRAARRSAARAAVRSRCSSCRRFRRMPRHAPAGKRVESRQSVLPKREQHVDVRLGRPEEPGQLLGRWAALGTVVEEVLLHLVEDHVQVARRERRAYRRERVHERRGRGLGDVASQLGDGLLDGVQDRPQSARSPSSRRRPRPPPEHRAARGSGGRRCSGRARPRRAAASSCPRRSARREPSASTR